MRQPTTALLLSSALLIGACSGTSTAPAAAPRPAPSCAPASAALVARITGLAPAGSGLHVQRAAGVRAPDRANVWLVGVRFTAPGVPGATGVWAVGGGLDGSGMLTAVDGYAQAFSDAPDADKTAAGITATDATVPAAKACAA